MLQQLDEAEESWQEHAAEAPEGVGQLQVRVLAAAPALCSSFRSALCESQEERSCLTHRLIMAHVHSRSRCLSLKGLSCLWIV